MSGRVFVVALAAAATVAAAIGSTAPWAWIETVPYDGTKGSSGWVTLAAALLALALIAAAAAGRAAWLAALAAVPAAGVVAVAGYHASDPDRYVGSSIEGIGAVGWGAVVTIAAGAALVVLALAGAWLLRDRRLS